jgi:hypothetical protein
MDTVITYIFGLFVYFLIFGFSFPFFIFIFFLYKNLKGIHHYHLIYFIVTKELLLLALFNSVLRCPASNAWMSDYKLFYKEYVFKSYTPAFGRREGEHTIKYSV